MEIEANSSSQDQSSLKLTLDQRITAFYQGGTTNAAEIFRKIVRTEDITLRTIEKKVKLLKENNPLTPFQRKVRSDKFLTYETMMEIEDYLDENPFAKAPDIVHDLEYDISVRTMQMALKELNYNYLPVKNAPLITEDQRDDRIKFAEANMDRGWNNVVFVDECSFHTHTSPHMAYQKQGTERLQNAIPKHPAKLHVFAGISLRGKTDLFIFQENLDAKLYVEILEETLLRSTRRLFGREIWFLCQDNDPKHTSKLAKDCYSRRKVRLIEKWPSASPDLNPIENIWALMKKEVARRMPRTLDELEESIIESWDLMSMETIEKCINSLPNRFRNIIENNGYGIKY